MEKEKEISILLQQLGMSSAYIGYRYLKYGICLVAKDSSYLFAATTRLYPDIAAEFHVTAGSVEHGMRTLIDVYWNQYGNQKIEEITGYPFIYKPTTRELIASLADYLQHRELASIF